MTPSNVLQATVGYGLLVHQVYRKTESSNFILAVSLFALLPLYISSLLTLDYPPLVAILITYTFFLTTLILSIVCYRVSPFHPLGRYPGPLACKITRLWLFKFSRRGQQHLYIRSLHDRYGDVVRIGPNELCICDSTAIAPMMGQAGLPKGPNWTGRSMDPPIPALSAIRDPVLHGQRRKPWNRGMSVSALREYESIVAKRAVQFINVMEQQKGTPNLAHWLACFSYDLINDIAFGGGSELLREGDTDGILHTIEQGMRKGFIFEHLPWLAGYAYKIPVIGRATRTVRETGRRKAQHRTKNGSTVKDLFYYLNNEDGVEKTQPNPDQVASDGSLAVIAGADTTAATLCNALYFLMRNPECYDRLQEEVDKFYPIGENALDPKYYSKMPYLEAVINETMRLYPGALSGSQRAPMKGSGGKAIGPYFIPEGNQVRVHTYTIQRCSRYFSHPDTFWPERWLIVGGLQAAPNPKEFVHNSDAFIPFSYGPANCVGKNLAMQEMRMVLCHFMQRLRVRFAPGWNVDEWERNLHDFFILLTGELPVIVEPRCDRET